MITDIQGLTENAGRRVSRERLGDVRLCDAAIHSTNSDRFSPTNGGGSGIAICLRPIENYFRTGGVPSTSTGAGTLSTESTIYSTRPTRFPAPRGMRSRGGGDGGGGGGWRSTTAPVPARCKNGHVLTEFSNVDDIVVGNCDVCYARFITRIALHSCRPCNYYICHDCFAGGGVSSRSVHREPQIVMYPMMTAMGPTLVPCIMTPYGPQPI